MNVIRIVSILALISAFQVAPAITAAKDEVTPQEQVVVTPAADDANLQERPADGVEALVPAPTPKTAIDWNQMEAARREARDRALALRQRSILDETQSQPAQ